MLFDIRGVKLSYPEPNTRDEKKIIERTVELAIREPSILDFIDNMPPSSVFYDLGSCIGVFSLYASKKSHEVWCFEPDPINYTRIVAGREESLCQVNAEQVAISDGKTNVETLMIEGGVNHAHHRILKTNKFAGAVYLEDKIKQSIHTYEVEVPAIAIDHFVKQPGVKFPTHMKIDIDGSEILFLDGASSTLKDHRLQEVIFELDKATPQYDFIIQTLSESGFRLHQEYFIAHGGDSLYNIHFKRD